MNKTIFILQSKLIGRFSIKMEFWSNGIPEFMLFTSLICLFLKKALLNNDFVQDLVSKLSLKCNSCQQKLNLDGNKHQHVSSVRPRSYSLNTRYENGKTNGLKTSSQFHFGNEGAPVSFGGSIGIKYTFGNGDKNVHTLNMEMKKFSTEIQKLLISSPSMFDEWYHRKSGVVILSVCQWKKPSTPTAEMESDLYVYTKGINVEVSLATGSICAERVAISQAHTSHPDLTGRHNLSAVAVLQLSTDMKETLDRVGDNPKLPCGVCQVWIEKLSCPKNFRVIAYPDRDLNQYIEFYQPRLTSS